MRKLITGAIVAAALAVPATPAFAIHDGTGMPGAVCSNPDSKAVGNNPNPVYPKHRRLEQRCWDRPWNESRWTPRWDAAAQPKDRQSPALKQRTLDRCTVRAGRMLARS